MNPSLVVLPDEFSIPDKDLLERFRSTAGRRKIEALLPDLAISQAQWQQVLNGGIVLTHVIQQLAGLLDRPERRGAA